MRTVFQLRTVKEDVSLDYALADRRRLLAAAKESATEAAALRTRGVGCLATEVVDLSEEVLSNAQVIAADVA